VENLDPQKVRVSLKPSSLPKHHLFMNDFIEIWAYFLYVLGTDLHMKRLKLGKGEGFAETIALTRLEIHSPRR